VSRQKEICIRTIPVAGGVTAKDIQTSNLDISSRDERGQRFSGFRVSNLVTVTSGDPAKVRTRGLELAFEEARGRAQTLAQLAKKSLGEAVCVSEAPSWAAGGAMNNTVSFHADRSSGTEAVAEDVFFSVSVVFELK
jgi:uncharacterized protein YggE